MSEAAALADSTFLNAPPRPGTGRPTLLTPAVAAQILFALEQGSYVEPACEAAGVSRHTVRNWLKRGHSEREQGLSPDDSPFVQFLNDTERAIATAETKLVQRVAATPDDWRAQAFVLERRHRERWGKSEQAAAANIQVIVSDKQAEAMLELLRLSNATNVTPKDDPPA